MKKLLLFLLLPLGSFAQVTDTNLNLEADTIRTETHAGRNTAQRVGRMFKNIIASKSNINGNTGVLAIAGGGTGTASPGLVAGTNISITGSWPNQTINQSGGAGITNSAPNNHLVASDGVNAIDAGIVKSGFSGSLTLGASSGVWNMSGGVYVAPSGFPFTGASGTFQANQVNATTNTVMWPGAFSRGLSSGTAAAGIGTGIELITVNASGTYKTGTTIESVSTNITGGTEAFDIHLKSMSAGSAASDKLVLKSTGYLSWTNLTLVNGWANITDHRYRVTPDDRLEVSFRLNPSSATNAVLGTASGLTIPSLAISGVIHMVGIDGSGNHVYVRASISSTSIVFDCPGYASAAGNVIISGSFPLESAVQ